VSRALASGAWATRVQRAASFSPTGDGDLERIRPIFGSYGFLDPVRLAVGGHFNEKL